MGAAVIGLRTHARTNVAICPGVPLPDYDREAGPFDRRDVEIIAIHAVSLEKRGRS